MAIRDSAKAPEGALTSAVVSALSNGDRAAAIEAHFGVAGQPPPLQQQEVVQEVEATLVVEEGAGVVIGAGGGGGAAPALRAAIRRMHFSMISERKRGPSC